MQEQTASYWKLQLTNAKEDNKTFFTDAKDCNKAYSQERSYNIFYSNTEILKANLLPNNPKPDIQRRFLKKAESDKLKYNTYLEVAKISEGCIVYYSDIYNCLNSFKDINLKSLKIGRGVGWVEYNPIIETRKTETQIDNNTGLVIQESSTEEYIAERELKVVSLNYDEFLCSTAKDSESIWWKARRHLMTKEELKNRFNYEAKEYELSFKADDKSQTQQKRGEVWEIWCKPTKQRFFILIDNRTDDFLEVQDDPYKLEGFFPSKELWWLDNGNDIIPIPEYKIYRSKAVELDTISKLSDNLEGVIKYVVTTDVVNQDNVANIANASEGDIVTLKQTNPMLNGQVPNSTSVLPVNEAIALADHREAKKQQLKADIYDITGISDIIRGVSDPNETAAAQKIKGVFGSLRFQDRQKKVQEFIKSIYQIMTEIICENWDSETMQEITCTELPTIEEKEIIKQKKMQSEAIQAQLQSNPQLAQENPQIAQMIPQITQEEIDKLQLPTWDDILGIMRSDKLRNYTIDIETTATAFDDIAMQNESILALSQSYQNIIATAAQFQDPTVIRGYIPIAKMQLTNIKTGRALSKQIIEALENAAKQLEDSKKQPTPPDPKIELMKADQQLKQIELQNTAKYNNDKLQIEMLSQQNKARELALKEQESQTKLSLQSQSDNRKAMYDAGILEDKRTQTEIKQQEVNRKTVEIAAEARLKEQAILKGESINTNLGGSPVV